MHFLQIALIFGISGALRGDELVKIKLQDISTHGKMLKVDIPETKTSTPRSFTIDDQFYDLIQQYQLLRPTNTTSDRFFVNFQNGKCTTQVIGKHKFSSMPKQIATFLGLPNSHLYTGHSFRRTSATLLADAGANITCLKRHGGWKSDKVAEGYINDSLQNKKKTETLITSDINLTSIPVAKHVSEAPSSSRIEHHNNFHQSNSIQMRNSPTRKIFTLNNCTVTINYLRD